MSGMLAVTGITGKTGSAFADRLAENAQEIQRLFPGGLRALARAKSDTAPLEKCLPQMEVMRGELSDAAYLDSALQDVDTLLHIAGVHFSRDVADAAARCGVRRLIAVHTSGVYSKYKAAGEEYRQIDAYVAAVCRENGIRLTILRPTMIYGCAADRNVITFIRMVDRLPLMPVVNGARYALQPVHYRDLGAAYYGVLINENNTADREFVLSGAAPIQLRDMLKAIGDCLHKRVRFISVPYPLAYAGACVLYAITLRRRDYREKVQRLCEPRAYAHDEASAAFGYAPMRFEEGVQGEVAEYFSGKEASKRP